MHVFNIAIPSDFVSKLHNDDLVVLASTVNQELLHRRALSKGPSYQDLVDQYGIDGCAKLTGQVEPSVIEPDVSNQSYLLTDLPENTFYDNTLDMFVYTPPDYIAKVFSSLVTNELGFPVSNLKGVELLIDPKLNKDSLVQIRVDTDNYIWTCDFIHPLKWIVEYVRDAEHKTISFPNTIPLRPVVLGEGTRLLQEFNGTRVVTEMELFGEVYQIAPVKIGSAINLKSASTLGALVKDGHIPECSQPARQMSVYSVYVQVGNHLVRLMTKPNPYAAFNPAQYTPPSMVLNLKVNAVLQKGDLDTFGNAYDFMELLDNGDTVTIGIHVTGLFHPTNGSLTFSAGPVTLKGIGSRNAELIDRLIGISTRVLAVEPVGEVAVF